ncbi:helix-turn-helix transcriptional regulator [Amycolatopsis tolypomycina]|uniref:helix-turn-helix transcriptional regulator n=1 Tax=Amycolatopsis tolypomycina TaxID=208445 RepID=UPI000B8743C8|nr:helix-turn-helix transcriptional regulator [Amycolatopsis tolypomycina]
MTVKQVGAELRRLREAAGQTQADVARIVGVSRANLTQWETGRYLPSVENARLLDNHFRPTNSLVELVESARSTTSAPAGVLTTGGSLLEVFRRAGATLAGELIRDENGRAVGWRHNLQKRGEHTTLATAYGVSAMAVLGEPYIDLHTVVEGLYARRSEFGWQGRSAGRRPEVTAAVVDALFQVSTVLSAEEALTHLEHSLDNDYSRTRPFLLATVLRTAARIGPDARLTRRLTDDLLAVRLDHDGVRLWGEKKEPRLVAPEPTTAHTARAVVALRELLRAGEDRADVREAVEVGTQWLVDRTHPDDGMMEDLALPQPGQRAVPVNIKHFTSAWVVQALAEAPKVPTVRLNRALGSLWERYEAGLGLWAWGSGDLPIWMTLDAVTALRAAALAFAAPPFLPPTVAE